MSEPDTSLAPLQMAVLDREKLTELFADIDALGEDVDIVVKRGRAHVGCQDKVSLASAMQLLTDGLVHGVQLRYRYRGSDWWDTLMATSEGYRLVRIQQGQERGEGIE